MQKQALYGRSLVSAVGRARPHYVRPLVQKLSIKRRRNHRNATSRFWEAANISTKAASSFQAVATAELNHVEHQGHIGTVQMTTNTSNVAVVKQFSVNVIIPTLTCSQAELAMYHHQSLGSPQKDTLLRSLREHPTQVETFPGLTYKLISTHLPPSEATKKGHMILTRKGLRLTKSMAKKIASGRRNISNFLPAEEICLAGENKIYCYIILGNSNDNTIYSDLTGNFSIKSYDRKHYIYCIRLQTNFYFYAANEIPRARQYDHRLQRNLQQVGGPRTQAKASHP